ncbi:glycerol dehydrogenase [Gorillibacterium timonense]|uniref:glycerol dehydrogenase n=1 Tax=Gorillibacterium timonense TaxID=1689269 RepID=UPI00071D6AF1|nr:glycerol dehydrogenase [Gorillibacterium timonense]
MKQAIFSPSKYIQGRGEIGNLGDYFAVLGSRGAYLIVDPFILSVYEKEISSGFRERSISFTLQKFNGECSKNEVDRIVQAMKEKSADVVIGIGGGKTLDTAKAVGFFAELPVVIVPTIASTDAPCSALSVLYTDEGQFDRYLMLKSNPNIVVVDIDVVAKAPERLLVAGMGDALSTYYEARACHRSGALSMAGGTSTIAALTIARACRDVLFADGLKAKLALENKASSKAVENIVEANTYLSGIGFESGGLAAAHAIHNGLTVLEETHHLYHGEKVAFGTLAQLALENAELAEIQETIDFCKSIGLPTTLKQLGVDRTDHDKIRKVAEASCADGETIHNMPFQVTPEDVFSAILVADRLGE